MFCPPELKVPSEEGSQFLLYLLPEDYTGEPIENELDVIRFKSLRSYDDIKHF
jgi:hypothetical protein